MKQATTTLTRTAGDIRNASEEDSVYDVLAR